MTTTTPQTADGAVPATHTTAVWEALQVLVIRLDAAADAAVSIEPCEQVGGEMHDFAAVGVAAAFASAASAVQSWTGWAVTMAADWTDARGDMGPSQVPVPGAAVPSAAAASAPSSGRTARELLMGSQRIACQATTLAREINEMLIVMSQTRTPRGMREAHSRMWDAVAEIDAGVHDRVQEATTLMREYTQGLLETENQETP